MERGATVAKNATTATDGKTYNVEYFNLDVIISVDYRVKSQRDTFVLVKISWILMQIIETLQYAPTCCAEAPCATSGAEQLSYRFDAFGGG